MEQVTAFFNTWNGKAADFDGKYGAQCVDLINFYNRDVIGNSFVNAVGAKDWFNNYRYTNAAGAYQLIVNELGNPNQVPQKGDVIVWGTQVGQYGHIAIFDRTNGKGSFVSFDQNWPTGTVCHFQAHDYKGVIGWLRPNKFIAQVKQDEVIMKDEAKKEIYRAALHREPENDQVWRGISPDPELALKQVKQSNEWLTQNHVLLVAYPQQQTIITNQQQVIAQLNQTVTKLTADDASDKAAVASALKQVESLTNQLNATQNQLQAVNNAVPKTSQERESDVSWITKLVALLLRK